MDLCSVFCHDYIHFLLYPTLCSLLYTSYPQATTYSTHSRSGFSCSPTYKFLLEPLTLFSQPGLSTLCPSSCIHSLFNLHALLLTVLFLSSPSFAIHIYMRHLFSPSSKACLSLRPDHQTGPMQHYSPITTHPSCKTDSCHSPQKP
jgi:hypothetical protein